MAWVGTGDTLPVGSVTGTKPSSVVCRMYGWFAPELLTPGLAFGMEESRRCTGLGLKMKSLIDSRFHRYATRSLEFVRQVLLPSAMMYTKGRMSTLEQA